MAAFRILSLDGGGLMGAFSASVLATLERTTQRSIVEHFDLITGTSTGGIIAVGLAMGAVAEQIVQFYEERGAAIFPPAKGVGGWLKTARNLRRPRFTPAALREAIRTVVGDRPMSAARTRLVIPAYDASMGRIYLFKTPQHPDRSQDKDIPAVDVALATSAAPTYFPAHTMPDHRGVFIDGGVWANCPAMVGIVEAVGFCGQRLEDVHVLSVSTTNYPFRIAEPIQLGGLLRWGQKIVETLMFGQAQGAVAQATSLLRDRFHRIDYLTEPRIYVLDDARVVEELITLGRGEAEKIEHRQAVRDKFLNGLPVAAPPTWS
jgi:patatin-like phospholipase/acyl hydrolase